MADNDPGTPEKVIVVASTVSSTLHFMGHGPGRRCLNKHGCRFRYMFDVVVTVVAVAHHMSSAAVRAGPSTYIHRPPCGLGEAVHMELTPHELQPNPSHHHMFRGWDAATPSPSHVCPILNVPARPFPARHKFHIVLARTNGLINDKP